MSIAEFGLDAGCRSLAGPLPDSVRLTDLKLTRCPFLAPLYGAAAAAAAALQPSGTTHRRQKSLIDRAPRFRPVS